MKTKSVSFSIRMPQQLKKAVAKQARKERRPASKIASKALEEFLKTNGHKKNDGKEN